MRNNLLKSVVIKAWFALRAGDVIAILCRRKRIVRICLRLLLHPQNLMQYVSEIIARTKFRENGQKSRKPRNLSTYGRSWREEK